MRKGVASCQLPVASGGAAIARRQFWFTAHCPLPTAHCRRAGLTLLELILAMAIMSLLAMSLYSTLYTAFKAHDHAVAAIQPVRAASVALDLIGRDLQGVLPPTGVLAGPFLGQSGAELVEGQPLLEFYTVVNDSYVHDVRGGGIRQIDLVLETKDEGQLVLVRQVSRTPGVLAAQDVTPEEEVICRGIKSVTCRYFQADLWQDTWDSTQVDNVLPNAVEVTLELDQGEGKPTYRMLRTYLLATAVTADQAAAGASGG